MSNSPILRHISSHRMSKVVQHMGTIYLSGQTSYGSNLETIEDQTQETLQRIEQLLREAQSDKTRIVSATIFLKRISDFDAMNRVWENWVPEGEAPARTTIEANLAFPELLVEITVIAANVE